MATVTIDNVCKKLDSTVILNKVNLDIEKGEFVALVGASGSGKSTLLRLVAGLDTVSSGSILINGKCVNKIPPAKRDMAMVFQTYALYPHMSVFANMAYGLKMRGMKRQLIQERVEVVSKMLQLSDYLYRLPGSLSGGQRQRVAMGRAIVRKPAVFLFDEPLSNLDAQLRTEMRHEIRKLHQALNTTCLYVTHDQTEAMTLADRVVVLNKGAIEQVGTPFELFRYPATLFVAGFIGHYPMNFINGIIKNDKVITDIGLEWDLPIIKEKNICAGQKVIVGIRPENIEIVSEPQPGILATKVEWIDDLGSDKLVRVITEQGHMKLLVRVFEDMPLEEEHLALKLHANKASLFNQDTGLKIGGWGE